MSVAKTQFMPKGIITVLSTDPEQANFIKQIGNIQSKTSEIKNFQIMTSLPRQHTSCHVY